MARNEPPRATDLTPALLRRWPLPSTGADGDKDTRGAVLVIGGCREIPGATSLAGIAALRAGAGRLQIATARSVAPLLGVAVPEARVLALAEQRDGAITARGVRAIRDVIAAADAVLLGPGMPSAHDAGNVLAAVLEAATRALLVIDAGALDVLRGATDEVLARDGATVITPHAREMAAVLSRPVGTIEGNPARAALDAARKFRCVAVMKGATTWIATPQGKLWCNRGAGNAGLGTSGSGDTLAGLIAGFGARGATPLHAAAWGVLVHARAGDALARRLGPLGFLAREIAGEVPAQLRALERRHR